MNRSETVEHMAPTASDDEWAEWCVDDVTVATGGPVTLYVDGRDGLPVEVLVPNPVQLARALLSARVGEWEAARPPAPSTPARDEPNSGR